MDTRCARNGESTGLHMTTSPINPLRGWRRALVVVAHPDDESFGLGAVLAALVGQACSVSVLCFTHGEASTLGAAEDLAAIRAGELRAAASELGVQEVTLMSYPDGALASVDASVLDRHIDDRLGGIDLLVAFESAGVTGHADHRAATDAAVRAAKDNGLPLLEWGLPTDVADALRTEFGVAFSALDGAQTETITVDRAVQWRAIACHATQATGNPVLARRLELQGDRETVRITPANHLDGTQLRYPAGYTVPPPGNTPANVSEQRTPWDDRYDNDDYVFGTEPNDFLAAHVGVIPAGPVLCIGDGEGRNGVHLAQQGHRVVSVDASSVGLAKAKHLASQRGVQIQTITADLAQFITTPAADGPWAAVVSIFCHLPRALRATLYPALAERLQPGGVFILESYTPSQIGRGTGGPQDPDMTQTGTDLASDTKALTAEHVAELDRPVIEGDLHSGEASVIQYIGRRPA